MKRKKIKINPEMPYGPGTYAIEASNKRWKPLKHLILVIELLIYLVQGKTNRLMVFMPPRHGKSELISKYFLSWYLGTFLEKRAILTSYGAGFAAKWGRQTRDLLQAHGAEMFLSDVLIRNDSKASHKWDIKGHKGGLVTSGSGGPIMGEGANLFIIDDPHKNSEEARSPTYQAKTWEWYLNTAKTRVERDIYDGMAGAMVYIAQRLDILDLAGQILKAEPSIGAHEALEILRSGGSIPEDTWIVLNLPLLAEEDDILGREINEPLWPERVDYEEAQRIKHAMGSFRFNALYQGDPKEREGSIFKRAWFKDENDKIRDSILIDLKDLPNNLNKARYWDFAKSGAVGDSTAGLLSSFQNGLLYFIELNQGKYTAKEVLSTFKNIAVYDNKFTVQIIEEEPGSGSGILIEKFRQDDELKGHKIKADKVRTSKADRAFDLEVLAENGSIRFVKAPWNETVIDQLINFTGEDGGVDDIVDTATGSARFWSGKTKEQKYTKSKYSYAYSKQGKGRRLRG